VRVLSVSTSGQTGRSASRPLGKGIPRAVARFHEHRAAHPEEGCAVVSEDGEVGWKSHASRAS
jgi:hypothetical protein